MIKLPLHEKILDSLRSTEQNPHYHAEGNVFLHTQKVVEAFHKYAHIFSLSDSEKTILYWVSVLHDLGKIDVTRFFEGRWVAHGHERKSVSYARNILMGVPDVSTSQRKTILDIIEWHGFPLRWVIKEEGNEDSLKRMITRLDLRLLGIFGYIDLLGRKSFDQDRIISKIKKLNEYYIPKVRYEFGSHSDYLEAFKSWPVNKKNAAWNALKMDRFDLIKKLKDSVNLGRVIKAKKIIMAMGPPFSGKSTVIKQKFPEGFHIHLEDFGFSDSSFVDEKNLRLRVIEFKHLLGIYVRRNPLVIIEGRILNPELRLALNEILRDMDLEIHYLICDASEQQVQERNQMEEFSLDNEDLLKEYDQLFNPHIWEPHSFEIVL